MRYFVLITFAIGVLLLLRRDSRRRPGISGALWIPTLWLGILCSRPLSLWLGAGGGVDTLEGSPLDRAFYFVLIAAAFFVVSRRRVDWRTLIAQNWPLLLFYGYLAVSVLWSHASLVSGKRWLKEFGNILIVLVLLTEKDPWQAIRVVFVRCAYVLIPLSVILIRYFPSMSRFYNGHTGALEIVGVTLQKNSLGTMVMVCGIILVWDLLANPRDEDPPPDRLNRVASVVTLGTGLWLLHACDSKTSLLCLAVGSAVIAMIRLPVLRRRIRLLGLGALGIATAFLVLDSVFDISRRVVTSLGRDMTFTGRTEVWQALLRLDTDPLIGTGYMGLWDNVELRSRLPEWVAYSAHNGYLEVYLAGGALGAAALGLLLLATGIRINRALFAADEYAVVRFGIYTATLLANFSETNFACMTPVGFMFIIAAIGEAPRFALAQQPYARRFHRPSEGTPAFSRAFSARVP